MGYRQSITIMYGVELPSDINLAKEIYDEYIDEGTGEMVYDEAHTITTELGYKNKPVHRDIPNMMSDGADSRIDNMAYGNGRDILGIEMASRGDDKIEDFLIPTTRTIQNFEKYIRPILVAKGLSLEPSIQILSQTW